MVEGVKLDLNIAYLYYNILNVYGDRGNILILQKIIKDNNIRCNVSYISIDDDFNHLKYDIVFMGGGQDNDQMVAAKDLIENKKHSLQTYIEDGGCGLYICGAFQLLGKKYISAIGDEIEGTGILDIYTEKGENRFRGDIIIQSSIFDSTLVGFENHSGRTFIEKYRSLGYVKYGKGNNGSDNTEGLMYKNTICTYMHGCFLSKNPEIIRFIIERALKRKYNCEYTLYINEYLLNLAKYRIIKKHTLSCFSSRYF